MSYGILSQSITPVRQEPFEHSEIVTQLLFGETFIVIEEHSNWLRIGVTHDSYEGWIDRKSSVIINDDNFQQMVQNRATATALKLFTAQADDSDFPTRLCPGSTLYEYDYEDNSFQLAQKKYKILSDPFDVLGDNVAENVEKLAKYYMNAPYLWGGRSPYGIDCSGLTQVVFKMAGMLLPRNASQQVMQGNTIEFVNQYRLGDLAFFGNEEGSINHVGIILENNLIIHSSGFVRIDKLDQQGIFSVLDKKYTHQLRVVKRIISQ